VKGALAGDSGDAEEVLAKFDRVGMNDSALAAELQREGTLSFDKSWKELMDSIASKNNALGKANQLGGEK